MTLFLIFLGMTLLLEAPFYLWGLKRHPLRTRVALWLSANLVSYPAVFFFFPATGWPIWAQEAASETWAPFSEILVGWGFVSGFCRRDAAIIIFANLFSWLTGRILVMLPAVSQWLTVFESYL